MKTKAFFICMMLFWVVTSDLSAEFTYNSTLPRGARARLSPGVDVRCVNVQAFIDRQRTPELHLLSQAPTAIFGVTPVYYLWDFDYSPDGKSLVVTDTFSYEGISIYDAKTAQKLRAGAGWSRIRNVVFSPNGKTIVVGREDGDIFLIDTDTATLFASPAKHRPRAPLNTVNLSIAWLSLDRSTLAWVRGRGSNSSSLYWSDLRGGSRRGVSGHRKQSRDTFPFILNVGFDSDGWGTGPYTVASASQDGIIHLWNINNGSHLQEFRSYVAESKPITDPDGRIIRIYDAERSPGNYRGGYAGSGTFNPNGHPTPVRIAVVALNSWGGWYSRAAAIANFDRYPMDSVQHPANIIDLFERDWEEVVISPGIGFSVPSAKDPILKHTFRGHTECVWSVVYGEEGEEVASASIDGTIRTWPVALGGQNQRFESHTKFESHTLHFSNIAFSRNRKALAIGHNNGAIQLWVNGTWWPAFKAHDGPISSLAFHPWWEPFEVTLESGEVEEVPVIPTLASASTDGTVRLWRLDFGSQELRPRTEAWVFYIKRLGSEEDFQRFSILQDPLITVGQPATSVAFSPDGSTLAIGSWHGVKVIKLWTARHSAPPIIDSKPVMSVAFSPESQTLAAGCLDGTILLGAITPYGRTWVLRGHTKSVFKVMFSPDGKTLASGSDDGTVLLWDHEPSTFRIIRGSKPLPSEDEETETETDEETETETDEETEAPSPGEDAPTPEDINADEDAADPSPEEDAPTPEDVNGDGVVNIQDLVVVSANMGATGENPADVNGDGVVNIQDLVLVANALGETP